MSRDRNNRSMSAGSLVPLANSCCYLEAIHEWHLEIQEHHVKGMLIKQIQRFASVRGESQGVTLSLQHAAY